MGSLRTNLDILHDLTRLIMLLKKIIFFFSENRRVRIKDK